MTWLAFGMGMVIGFFLGIIVISVFSIGKSAAELADTD